MGNEVAIGIEGIGVKRWLEGFALSRTRMDANSRGGLLIVRLKDRTFA